jgi:hypothetical protein
MRRWVLLLALCGAIIWHTARLTHQERFRRGEISLTLWFPGRGWLQKSLMNSKESIDARKEYEHQWTQKS